MHRWIGLIAAAAALSLVGCGSASDDQPSKPGGASDLHYAGVEFVLSNDTLAAANASDYDDLRKYVEAGDKKGATDMADAGRIIVLKSGVKIKVIERVGFSDELDVRVESGEASGREVWITDVHS